MSSEIRQKLEIKALRSVLESFDSIYGLDDEQTDLLDYEDGAGKVFEDREFRLSFLISFEDGDCQDVLSSSVICGFFPEGDVRLAKISKISDKLFSVTVLLLSKMPFLLVKEIGKMASSNMTLSGLVADSSLVKVSRN